MTASVQFSSIQSLSHVQLFVILWTVAHQTPPSMGFSRQECLTGLPCPSPGDIPDPGIEPMSSPALKVDSLPVVPPGKPIYTHTHTHTYTHTIVFNLQMLAKGLNRYFCKEDIQMADRYKESCSMSLIIQEKQIKAQ